jgi:hypothetical protein
MREEKKKKIRMYYRELSNMKVHCNKFYENCYSRRSAEALKLLILLFFLTCLCKREEGDSN